MTINFDMDGTIADLYGVEGWLDYLLAEDTYPYDKATPLLNMSALARRLNQLQKKGCQLRIISWTSKNGSSTYNKAVERAKKRWLKKHLPSVHFDIIIVPYGTPKSTLSNGILFDDEPANRKEWGAGAYDVHNILDVLKAIA